VTARRPAAARGPLRLVLATSAATATLGNWPLWQALADLGLLQTAKGWGLLVALSVAIFGALLNASGISEAALHTAGSVAAGGFTPIFAATAIGFVIAFIFILWMKERPLRSSARHAAEAVVVD
jgi:hypothetical protein